MQQTIRCTVDYLMVGRTLIGLLEISEALEFIVKLMQASSQLAKGVRLLDALYALLLEVVRLLDEL